MLLTLALALSGCATTDEPATATPNAPAEGTRATAIDDFARYLYVEVNDVNILNAGEYTLSNGDPFFTHVVIFAANIRADKPSYAYNNPNVAGILSDPDKYIRPLQAKGIKVLLSYMGDHTGLGFSNLTQQQTDLFTDAIVAQADKAGLDGFDLDDEWAEYGTKGFPSANSTSYSNMIIDLRSKTDKLICVLDYNTFSLSAEAAACVDLACYGWMNGYSLTPDFPLPLSKYCVYLVDLRFAPSDTMIRVRTMSAIRADSGGIAFYNLPMQPTMLSKFNGAAMAFGLTCSHSGVTYPKDY